MQIDELIIPASVVRRGQRLKSRLTVQSPPLLRGLPEWFHGNGMLFILGGGPQGRGYCRTYGDDIAVVHIRGYDLLRRYLVRRCLFCGCGTIQKRDAVVFLTGACVILAWRVGQLIKTTAQNAGHVAFLVLCCFSVAGCGVLPAQNASMPGYVVVVGRDTFVTTITGLRGASPVMGNSLMTAAQQYAPNWQQATKVSSRYVAITMRTPDGAAAWGVQSRPVWLVTFQGAPYALAGLSQSSCSCAEFLKAPSTAVALDAQDASLVVAYGLPDTEAPAN